MTMRAWRLFFLVAGAFNILGGSVAFFAVGRPFLELGLAPPRYPFAFRILLLAVVVLGIGYLMVAHDPWRNRNVVWLGFLTKTAGFGMQLWAIHDGQLPVAAWRQPLIQDLPWAVAFAFFLWRTRSLPPVKPAASPPT